MGGKKDKSTWERRMDKAQKEHRPSLKDWESEKWSYSGSPTNQRYLEFKKTIGNKGIRNITVPNRNASTDLFMKSQNIDRISSKHLSVQDFIDCYELKNIPLIISDIPKNDGWLSWIDVKDSWSMKNLKSNYGNEVFKCGEDDDGYPIKVKMKYYLKYVQNTHADSPLYVFDSKFDTKPTTASIGDEYDVPKYFKDDLFKFAGERRRPPYKWLLVGPQRSGTCSHIDPLATSAWNTLISGRKYWAVFPPNVTKEFAKCKKYVRKNEDDEAINYFVDHLPRLKHAYMNDTSGKVHRESFNSNYPCPFVEFVQEPGDTVYVPGGWWHAVLNVEDSIAITQNFCSKQNFNEVWLQTRTGRVKMAQKWLKTLKEMGGDHESLAHRAIALNTKDNFKFETKQERVERKRIQEEKKKMKKERKKKEGEIVTDTRSSHINERSNKNKRGANEGSNHDKTVGIESFGSYSKSSDTNNASSTSNSNSPLTTEDSFGSDMEVDANIISAAVKANGHNTYASDNLRQEHVRDDVNNNNDDQNYNSRYNRKKSKYPRDWKDKARDNSNKDGFHNQKKKKKKMMKK